MAETFKRQDEEMKKRLAEYKAHAEKDAKHPGCARGTDDGGAEEGSERRAPQGASQAAERDLRPRKTGIMGGTDKGTRRNRRGRRRTPREGTRLSVGRPPPRSGDKLDAVFS